MKDLMNTTELYQLGGTLTSEHPSYVSRKADEELYNYLVQGEYCYVLNSRQMGKSSLAAQTRNKLRELKDDNIISAIVNLDKISENSTRQEWYESIAQRIMEFMDEVVNINNFDWKDYWNEQNLDPLNRLGQLISKLVSLTDKSIVLFLDEVDTVLLLKFDVDDLFTYIRSCYNDRANLTKFNRITFCIIGVGTPADFIQNKNTTSFNIGKQIELNGFTIEESEPLLVGLKEKFEHPKTVLQNILDWTNGQPFLTQKICKILLQHSENSNPNVSDIVEKFIIKNWEDQDIPPHLRTIKDRVLNSKQNEPKTVYLLETYKQILEENKIVTDDISGEIELRLSGLILKKDGRLQPFNRIYEKIFNLEWVEIALAKIRPYHNKFEQWQNATEEHKQLYLLYGKELDDALTWKKERSLAEQDIDYILTESQRFWDKAKFRLPDDSNYESIIIAIQSWTEGNAIFNESLFNVNLTRGKNTFPSEQGNEENWVKQLVDTFKQEWQRRDDKDRDEAKRKLGSFVSRFHEPQKSTDSFWLLLTYRQLLKQETIIKDINNLEHQELLDMMLVEEERGKLKICNRLYKEIFNEQWVQGELAPFRPENYSTQFVSWLDLKNQDNFLSIEVFHETVEWGYSNRKDLKPDEHRFLTESLMFIKGVQMSYDVIVQFRDRLIQESKFPYSFMDTVLDWTRNHPILTPMLCDFIIESLSEILNQQSTYQQAKREIDRFIRQKMSEKSLPLDIQQHLDNIFDTIVNEHSQCDKFDLLVQYRQISFSQEDIENDSTLENQLLCQYQLAYQNSDNLLKIFNKIYEVYFDKTFLLNKLSQERIYATEFITWLDNNQYLSDELLTNLNQKEDFQNWIYNNNLKLGKKEADFLTNFLIAKHDRSRT